VLTRTGLVNCLIVEVPCLGIRAHLPYSFKLSSVSHCLRFGEVLPTIGGCLSAAHVSGAAVADCLGALAAWLAPRSSSDHRFAHTGAVRQPPKPNVTDSTHCLGLPCS
jgi:hypothetical protein